MNLIQTDDHPFLDCEPTLQSASWRRFQENLGLRCLRLSGEGYSSLVVEDKSRFGKYWLLPYGPVLKNGKYLKPALAEIYKQAHSAQVDWLKIEPYGRKLNVNLKEVKDPVMSKLKPAVRLHDPHYTIVCDLSQSEDQLLAKMSGVHRRSQRYAAEKGVVCKKSENYEQDLGVFVGFIHEVMGRTKAKLHSDNYYKSQIVCLEQGTAELWLAYHQDKPVAAVLMHLNSYMATYMYAASTLEARKVEANPALVWQTMKSAKARGAKWYDFFGIAAPDADKNDPWLGHSEFKRKFGGEVIKTAYTWDLPLNQKRYLLYRAAQKAGNLR